MERMYDHLATSKAGKIRKFWGKGRFYFKLSWRSGKTITARIVFHFILSKRKLLAIRNLFHIAFFFAALQWSNIRQKFSP
jgi:hypothetical protein